MDQKKTGWMGEFRSLLGGLLSPQPSATKAAGGDAQGSTALEGEARDMLRFLVKVGQVDGRFDPIERAFVVESLRQVGHETTEADLDAIAAETRFRGAHEIVRPFRERAAEFRERLLRTGVLLAAASGRVTSDEHKALRQVSNELDLPRDTLDRLVKEAIEARGEG